jgi:hypothetical protein
MFMQQSKTRSYVSIKKLIETATANKHTQQVEYTTTVHICGVMKKMVYWKIYSKWGNNSTANWNDQVETELSLKHNNSHAILRSAH